jgi:CRISPR system Cascade subunit CasD
MPDFLVFQLYGVLASWGDIAVGEHRPSQGHPSKSAITGLLAAALGIDREDDAMHTKLGQHYGVAVCVQSAGEMLRDYHTIQVPGGKREYASRRDELRLPGMNLKTGKSNLETILSQRDYRTDALYQISIWSTDDSGPYTLGELQKALQQPQFNLYLGRKSCPLSLPLYPVILPSMTLKQAFNDYPDDKAEDWTGNLVSTSLISYFWEPGNLTEEELGMKASMTYPRRDLVSSRKRWQFSNRDEYYYAEAV